MKTDISIHFTLKGAWTISDLVSKLTDFYTDENSENPKFLFYGRTNPRTVLHHCFLPKKMVEVKKLPTAIYDELLDFTSEDQVCWFGTSGRGIALDRVFMLENLKKLNGVAIFLGEIKDGVQDEYNLCQELGIECILIP